MSTVNRRILRNRSDALAKAPTDDLNANTPWRVTNSCHQLQDVQELLIEAGADVKKRGNHGRSALDVIDWQLDPHDLADLLIEHGAP